MLMEECGKAKAAFDMLAPKYQALAHRGGRIVWQLQNLWDLQARNETFSPNMNPTDAIESE